MFGNNKKEKQSPVVVAKQSSSPQGNQSSGLNINSLGAGTKMEGTINSDADIRIDGELVGTLHCKGKVIIGPKGFVDGNIECANAVIEGHFKGVMKASELLNVTESAVLDGEVTTGKLAVHPGAKFNVQCATGSGKSAPTKPLQEKMLSFAKG